MKYFYIYYPEGGLVKDLITEGFKCELEPGLHEGDKRVIKKSYNLTYRICRLISFKFKTIGKLNYFVKSIAHILIKHDLRIKDVVVVDGITITNNNVFQQIGLKYY